MNSTIVLLLGMVLGAVVVLAIQTGAAMLRERRRRIARARRAAQARVSNDLVLAEVVDLDPRDDFGFGDEAA